MARTRVRYSRQFKLQAVSRAAAEPDQIPAIARDLGIDESVLYRWRRQTALPPAAAEPEAAAAASEPAAGPAPDDQTQRLRHKLLETALTLASAIGESSEGAPLNQLSAALGLVVDRLLRLEAARPPASTVQHEEVIRIEYIYPDGTRHTAPPWAEDDSAFAGPISRGRLRSPFWQDRNSQADDSGTGPARG